MYCNIQQKDTLISQIIFDMLRLLFPSPIRGSLLSNKHSKEDLYFNRVQNTEHTIFSHSVDQPAHQETQFQLQRNMTTI